MRFPHPRLPKFSLADVLLLTTAFALALTVTGCGGPDYAHRRVDGETVFFTDHWSSPTVGVVFGLICIVVGLKPLYDHWRQTQGRPNHKRRGKRQGAWKLRDLFNFHHLFAIAGVIIVILTFFSARYHYVEVSPQRFYSHWEKMGRPSLEVELDDLHELRLTTARVSGGLRGGTRRTTRMEFILMNYDRRSQLINSGAEGAALRYLIEKAPEWGFRVDDRREVE